MRNGRMLRKWRGFCVCSAVLLLLGGCSKQTGDDKLIITEGENDTVSYEYVMAEIDDVTLTQRVRCVYRQQNYQEVSFPVSGRLVDKIYVGEGDSVRKGDLLATLSADSLKRQIEDLEYRISRNELLLSYAEMNESLDISQAWVNHVYNGMFSSDGIKDYVSNIQKNYRYQREDLSDTLELDRLKLDDLKKQYENSFVYAQMDGVVSGLKDKLRGSVSDENVVIMNIIDNSQCLFEVEQAEFKDCFKEGESVQMVISVGNAAGTYELMPYQASQWQDVLLFSVIDGPATTGLKLGTSGTIEFDLEKREQVLSLPILSIFGAGERNYVYVEGQDGMKEIRWVETGLVGDNRVEILSGLTAGEKVILK